MWWQSEAVHGFLFSHEEIPEQIMFTLNCVSCVLLIYPLLKVIP